jgi:hypothetical protein
MRSPLIRGLFFLWFKTERVKLAELQQTLNPNWIYQKKFDGELATYQKILTTKGLTHLKHPENPGNSLLVVWTGSRGRPMMPMAPFCQATWGELTDLLLLRSKVRGSFAQGVAGLGANFEETISGLAAFIERNGYQEIRILGTSLGTVPALLSIPHIKPKHVLLAGPVEGKSRYPDEFQNLAKHVAAGSETLVSILVGGKAAADLRVANELVESVGASKHLVSGAGHNPLWDLVLQRKLQKYFKDSLFSDHASEQSFRVVASPANSQRQSSIERWIRNLLLRL